MAEEFTETKMQIIQIHLGPEINKGIIYYLEESEYKSKHFFLSDNLEIIDFNKVFDFLRKSHV